MFLPAGRVRETREEHRRLEGKRREVSATAERGGDGEAVSRGVRGNDRADGETASMSTKVYVLKYSSRKRSAKELWRISRGKVERRRGTERPTDEEGESGESGEGGARGGVQREEDQKGEGKRSRSKRRRRRRRRRWREEE